ncbi:LOW QUALITY PROTEIN: serine protease inhibitor 2.1-like [Zootoca vivipara]|uniref:LOW QUALITY PROTEIN: serine protease inhibitor 2.1-like n=1 Tax=Zootoca vivipara TaxID=8524 RepID=UPI00293C0ED9|nr:LOW QUALITY PROTEIN: serine protease inhibitor 2.1-like [Zootoca vivipara]
MFHTYLYGLLAGFCVFAHCHHTYERWEDHGSDPPSLQIAPGNTGFAFRSYHQRASEHSYNNIFFSPLSISTAFAMVSLRARTTTLSELLSGLGFNQADISEQEIHEGFRHLFQMLNNPDGEIHLSIGNALFTDDQVQLLDKFLDDAKTFYETEVLPTNFKNPEEAESQINSYIEKKLGKLVNVYKKPGPDAVMVLVNYIFLKAFWENPFDSQKTKDNDFFVDEQTAVTVPMMKKDSLLEFYQDEDLSCKVVKLPYKGNASALFILPDQGKMKQLEDALNEDVLLKWMNSLKTRRIQLFLPKLSISGSYSIKGKLQKMGITDVFTDQADLSGFTGKPELQVSEAFHEAVLNVHEAGTEAAAATAVEAAGQRFRPTVMFNMPFLVLIFHDITNSILFMRRVANPQKG